MAKLHYQRWVEKFSIDTFSSEDSMRDYLFSNPTLIFEEDTLVIPIKEEKCLPESSLDKKYGRADIILCRIWDKDHVKGTEELSPEDYQLWIVELKKNEVSYKNGFKQLFDYMTVVKNDHKIQKEIKGEVKRKVEKYLDISELKLKDSDVDLRVFGSLVAPSFGLIERTTESIGAGVTNYKEDYINLEKVLIKKEKLGEGFTLIDVVDAARCELLPYISLVKLIRFKRGDETIIYSEDVRGKKSTAQVARVDPVKLFQNNAICEDNTFYFRDNKGKDHKDVKCRVLNKRGPSSSFMIEIVSTKVDNPISIPKWSKVDKKYKWQELPIPIENTSKACSMALHKLFGIYNEDELVKYYWSFGEKNFIRKRDEKSLSDLREEQRLR